MVRVVTVRPSQPVGTRFESVSRHAVRRSRRNLEPACPGQPRLPTARRGRTACSRADDSIRPGNDARSPEVAPSCETRSTSSRPAGRLFRRERSLRSSSRRVTSGNSQTGSGTPATWFRRRMVASMHPDEREREREGERERERALIRDPLPLEEPLDLERTRRPIVKAWPPPSLRSGP